MNVLGLSGAVDHDASAALVVDGELVCAAEEERFLRDKHAKKKFPLHAARYCLEQAGLSPSDIHAVAFPYAPVSLLDAGRWHYAARHWYAPDRALLALVNGNRRYRRNRARALALLDELGFDTGRVPFVPVEHHLAHASSAWHLSGFTGEAAILSLDGKGEYATTLIAHGRDGEIHKIREFHDPDSLGGMYGAFTEYLGFEMLDGEFRVMGMAPYGDATRFDLSRLLRFGPEGFRVDTRYLNVTGLRRYRDGDRRYFFSPELVRWLGPPRVGDAIDEPYIHHAAAIQSLLEEAVLAFTQHYLGAILERCGRLCLAGGVALNVKLNQRLLALPSVREVFVQPAAGDAGTAVGAATCVAQRMGDVIRPMRHAYLGPAYTTEQCLAAVAARSEPLRVERLADAPRTGAEILAAGHPLAWFQGRMEFGPRALGNRSILGNPATPGIAERINAQIKYRERWRPFCPSLLDTVAADILGTDHPAPFMTLAFEVAPHWRERIAEVVHRDGTARAQVVTRDTNPRYYALIAALGERTGIPVVLNTSMNRRGEPMVCSPADALEMFLGSGLEYLVMEDLLVTR